MISVIKVLIPTKEKYVSFIFSILDAILDIATLTRIVLEETSFFFR